MAERSAVVIFLAFAFAYFFSALLRAVTATLAPIFSTELGLRSADLGLLAGAYFLGFSALQLPLGSALDRYGPKRVLLSLLTLGVLGCMAFAAADSLTTLFAARMLIGMGVSACLMAPLTCYRRLFSPAVQLRANSWMLMTGSLGMLASTLPVQWLLPALGWRGLFWVLALAIVAAMFAIAWAVPADAPRTAPTASAPSQGYRQVLLHPIFLRSAPLGFVLYGGMIAVQALWAGPWLTRVAGGTADEAAQGLFAINACMLVAFMSWGAVMPRLMARGLDAAKLMTSGLPLSLLILAAIVLHPAPATAWVWAAWCVSCTFVTLSQPAVGQAFPAHLAGRALSAFNLVIFLGVFSVQWGIGLIVDLARYRGASDAQAFRLAFAIFGVSCLLSYLWFAFWPRGAVAGRTGQ